MATSKKPPARQTDIGLGDITETTPGVSTTGKFVFVLTSKKMDRVVDAQQHSSQAVIATCAMYKNSPS